MAEILNVGHSEDPIAQIDTEEAAINYVRGLIADMNLWRVKCDLYIPDKTNATVKAQNRILWTFLVKHGKVVGALQALLHVGKLSGRAYQLLNQEAVNSLVPTMVGSV